MAIFDRFHYGACYYPEHWDASRHESDIARMAAVGFNVVRLGEGAWGYWEPEEGKFQFDLFDRTIDLCRKHGIYVIMGTPTYCAPAWVATTYPEVLRWDFQRRPMGHGGRRNFNYTAPKFLELSDKICTAMAEHYKKEKQIIGWQLDNEFNCHMDVSYAPSDTAEFRVWLKAKYKTIEALNKAWGAAFWSQQYNNFEQIDLPQPVPAYMNPSQLLDESRFISAMVVRFAGRQANILRKANAKWKITHNALFNNVDGPKLVSKLDFFSHDQYPGFWPEGAWTGFGENLTQARSLSYPFAVLEQQSGPGGQMEYLHRTPRPGQLRAFAWQSIAHGAKVMEYFRWRTCPYGSEQHWHGILDPDNRDNRRLAEVKQVGYEVYRMPKAFYDAPMLKSVAVMRDFDNEINESRINTYIKDGRWERSRWVHEFLKRQVPVDLVWDGQEIGGYRLLILPHFKIVTKRLIDQLTKYVRAGGTLVLGAQSGLKDANCHLAETTPPGLFRELAGIEVADWTTLAPGQTREAVTLAGRRFPLISFGERLSPRGAEILAHWSEACGTVDAVLLSSPAVTVNKVGKGQVIYIGGYCPVEGIAALAAEFCERLELAPVCVASDAVEALGRGKSRAGGAKWLTLINHSPKPEPVRGLGKARELISGKPVADSRLVLPGYGVAVIER